jgi:catechol-2,3-dioxygenase
VLEIDHEFCVSIYIRDPSGNMVEFCHSVRGFTEAERARAAAIVADPSPTLDEETAKVSVWQPITDDQLVGDRN